MTSGSEAQTTAPIAARHSQLEQRLHLSTSLGVHTAARRAEPAQLTVDRPDHHVGSRADGGAHGLGESDAVVQGERLHPHDEDAVDLTAEGRDERHHSAWREVVGVEHHLGQRVLVVRRGAPVVPEEPRERGVSKGSIR